MELHFLIPAVSFLLVTSIVAGTGILRATVNGGPPGRGQWLILVSGLIAALPAWIGERFAETVVTGSGQSLHFLLKGSTASDQNVVPWVGIVYFTSIVLGMLAFSRSQSSKRTSSLRSRRTSLWKVEESVP